MIIGINTDHHLCDKKIDLSFKKSNLPVREILYHKTILSIHDKFKNIRLLIVPTNIEGNNQYSFITLIEHIRLSYNFPIFVYKNGDVDTNQENKLLNILTDSEIQLYDSNVNEINSLSILTNDQIIRIISNLNPERPNSSGHDMSNRWGPYKLLKTLNFFNPNINYKHIENSLSEDLYFKKLIYLNNKSSNDFPEKIKKEINNKLNIIKGFNKKICLIDDESHRGWELVYKEIFKSSDFKSLYKLSDNHDSTEKDFETFKRNFSSNNTSYDLIILDLRLFERTADNIVDIKLLQDLSGIQILNISKNKFPTTPILISTASDKAWNYENIINSGANGFWTKESPDLNYNNTHSLNNLFNLLKNIEQCLIWRDNIHNIFLQLDDIYNNYSNNSLRSNTILIKKKTIFSQLHMQYSNFLKKYSNQSGYEFAFESAWGLLLNDIIDIKATESSEVVLKKINSIKFSDSTKNNFYKRLFNNHSFKNFLRETIDWNQINVSLLDYLLREYKNFDLSNKSILDYIREYCQVNKISYKRYFNNYNDNTNIESLNKKLNNHKKRINSIDRFISKAKGYPIIIKDNFKYLRLLRNNLPTTHGSDSSNNSYYNLSSIHINDIKNLIDLCYLITFKKIK